MVKFNRISTKDTDLQSDLPYQYQVEVEDDLQFFNYLFTNEGGINPCNNVAHRYYHFTHYHLDKFHLFLAALLKIAQYTFSGEE